jgi:hypothetical protein
MGSSLESRETGAGRRREEERGPGLCVLGRRGRKAAAGGGGGGRRGRSPVLVGAGSGEAQKNNSEAPRRQRGLLASVARARPTSSGLGLRDGLGGGRVRGAEGSGAVKFLSTWRRPRRGLSPPPSPSSLEVSSAALLLSAPLHHSSISLLSNHPTHQLAKMALTMNKAARAAGVSVSLRLSRSSPESRAKTLSLAQLPA